MTTGSSGALNITNSVIGGPTPADGNRAEAGVGTDSLGEPAAGGGIVALYGDVTITNTTIQNNTVMTMDERESCGGGLYTDYNTVVVTGGTIRDNTATVIDGTGQAMGGGVCNGYYSWQADIPPKMTLDGVSHQWQLNTSVVGARRRHPESGRHDVEQRNRRR